MIALYLVATVVVLQALDAWTTYKIIRAGGRELNGILARLFAKFGLVPGLAISKGGLAAMIAGLHWLGAWQGPSVVILGAIAVWYAGIVLHNLGQIRRG